MGAIRHQVVVRGGRRHQAPSALTGTIDEMLFDLPRTDLDDGAVVRGPPAGAIEGTIPSRDATRRHREMIVPDNGWVRSSVDNAPSQDPVN